MPRLPIKQKTLNELHARSGNRCAFPECTQELFPKNDTGSVSNICHIEAASPEGQRYNPNSTDEKRRSYDNLILLCANHHRITDDTSKYSVEKMKAMRDSHEQHILERRIEVSPSLLSATITFMASIPWEREFEPNNNLESFSIDTKLKYNRIRKWKPRINEYKKYQAKVDSAYTQLEKEGRAYLKDKVLAIIKDSYLVVKGEYLSKYPDKGEVELIQEYSDQILYDIEDHVLEKHAPSNVDINIAIPVIMVDAFMRCKILEKPPSKNGGAR